MRYILYIFLILFAYGCQLTTAQKMDETLKEDQELENLLKKVDANNKLSLQVQAQASEEQKKIVSETVHNITTLKEEVTTLKTELKDVKEKLDSVSADTGSSFILLPISKNQDNR